MEEQNAGDIVMVNFSKNASRLLSKMKHTLADSNFIEIMMTILAIILIIVVTFVVCRIISNVYTSKKKGSLFDKARPLSDMCSNNGKKVLDDSQKFWEYIDQLGLNRTINCSSSIVANASNDAIKYLIKYSNIEPNEECLQKIEYCIDWLRLYEQTKAYMKSLSNTIKKQLPVFVRLFTSGKRLPYKVCDVSYKMRNHKPPKVTFEYTSSAGRSHRYFWVEISIDVFEYFETEICRKLSKARYTKSQRNAMTNDLREAIKKRDNYTCCICGNSVLEEPNLLLEVDHIVPISKGGKTEASNLQTLCWRCNRNKGNRIE